MEIIAFHDGAEVRKLNDPVVGASVGSMSVIWHGSIQARNMGDGNPCTINPFISDPNCTIAQDYGDLKADGSPSQVPFCH